MQIERTASVVFIHNFSAEQVMKTGGTKKQPKGLFEE